MRVLVTGGTGFIGSRVVDTLLSKGHEVLLLSRKEHVDSSRQKQILVCDLSNIISVKSKLSEWEPEACIHMAWYAEPKKYNNSVLNLDYLKWSLNLQKLLLDIGCKKIIVAGTCAEYGFTDKLLKEDDVVDPQNIYAASKVALYMTGKELSKLYGSSYLWARIFFPYGPGEDTRRAVAAVICALKNNKVFKASEGKQIRDYLYVDDIANAFVRLLETDKSGCFNICSSNPVSIKDIMIKIGKIMNKVELIEFGAIPHKEWDPPFICGDNSKLRDIDWKPLYTLEDGIELTVKWWDKK